MKLHKPATIFFLLITNVLVAVLFILPAYQDSNDRQAVLTKEEEAYNRQVDYARNLFTIQEELNKREDILEKVNSAIPSEFSLAQIMYFLQTKTNEYQMTLDSVAFSKGATVAVGVNQNNDRVKATTLSVNVSGSYESFKKLLGALEESARIFEVQSISFSSAQEVVATPSEILVTTQTKPYRFKLEMKVYTYTP